MKKGHLSPKAMKITHKKKVPKKAKELIEDFLDEIGKFTYMKCDKYYHPCIGGESSAKLSDLRFRFSVAIKPFL